MAKVVSERIGRPVAVWTVDPLLSCGTGQEEAKMGVDNPAFYDSETGLCSKVDPKKKQNSWSDNTSYTKRQYNGRLIFLLVAIFILLAVLVAMVTTVVYLAVGEVRMSLSEDAEFQELEEEGLSLVEGHLRITNRVFTKDLLDPKSEAFKKLSSQIRLSMDAVFLHTIQNYNVTRVLDYREGSVIARCHIHFSKPRMDATHQVGMAVIQALERHHGYLPGGLLQVDIRSLHFTGLPGVIDSDPSDAVRLPDTDDWSEWSEWSPCAEPCEMQTRFRKCQTIDVGCLGNDREIRNCPCDVHVSQMNETTVSSTTVISEIRECSGDCEDGQVCIYLSQTSIARCLVPRDANDPTGCGGWCVGEHQLCKRLGNNTYQCADNAAACKEGEWQCDNGLCIAASGRCNSRIECYDMSDELNCECGEGHFLCGNSTPCIPENLRCNGKIDCWDASDEVNCTKSCHGDKFTCNFGGCIDIILFCDRFPDCADGSDEPEGCNEPCLPTQKQCRNGRCIDYPLWCNGDDNCKDGSDELNCPHNEKQPKI